MKTLETINLIEIHDGIVQQVISFDASDPEQVEAAEKLFIEIAVDNGAPAADYQGNLDDGYFMNGDYSVCLSWAAPTEVSV